MRMPSPLLPPRLQASWPRKWLPMGCWTLKTLCWNRFCTGLVWRFEHPCFGKVVTQMRSLWCWSTVSQCYLVNWNVIVAIVWHHGEEYGWGWRLPWLLCWRLLCFVALPGPIFIASLALPELQGWHWTGVCREQTLLRAMWLFRSFRAGFLRCWRHPLMLGKLERLNLFFSILTLV